MSRRRKSNHCRQCKAALFRYETDGRGNLLEVFDPCRCEKRRKVGLCLDCDRPVSGEVGKAIRCDEHWRAARLDAVRRYYQKQKVEKGTSYVHPTTKRSHRRASYLKRQRERARLKAEERKKDPEKLARYLEYRHTFSKYGHPNREKKLAYMREYNARPEVKARKSAQKYGEAA